MSQRENKMRKYIRAVSRRLNLPKEVRKRVMTDFTSAIQSRKEAGKTDAEIYAELGTPQEAAMELNEQMKEFAYQKSPWRWVCLGLVVLCVLVLLHGGIYGLLTAILTSSQASMGIIGGADGPTAVFITTSSDYQLYQYGVTLLLLIMGMLGFFTLSRIRKK